MQATRNNPSAIPNIPSPAQCLQEKARLQEDDQALLLRDEGRREGCH